MFQSSTSQQKTSAVDFGFYRKQLEAFVTLATDLLFGGASEGGKSVFIRLACLIWCMVVPGLQIFIYRKFYKDVIANHMQGEMNFKILACPWIEAGLVEITENQVRFKNGSLITLAQLRTEEDFEKAQGIPKHVLVVDEATQCKPHHIAGLRGWVRMSREMQAKLPGYLRPLMKMIAKIFAERWPGEYPEGHPNYTDKELSEFFPRIIQTANPIGTGVGYYRRRFVMANTPGKVWRAPDDDGGFLRQFILSLVTDNPNADPEAQRRRLSGMGKKVADALIYGLWDAPGGDYFPEWDEERHVVEDCRLPKWWFRFRVVDVGYAEPFFVLWLAVSDGQEFQDQHGNTRWFPRGALIGYREWNGCDKENPERGLWMRNKDIAAGIVHRTPETTSGITLADSLPFQDRGMGEGKQVRKIKDEFAEEGVALIKANTARIHGWSLMRDRLIGQEVAEGFRVPMLYVFRSLNYSREYIPALTYHEVNPEDAQDKGEATHSTDCWRMGCATLPIIWDEPAAPSLQKLAEQNRLTIAGARKEHERLKKQRGRRF